MSNIGKLIERLRTKHFQHVDIVEAADWLELLYQFVRDTCDGFDCLPGCDSWAHEELCPLANPIPAWRQMQETIKRLQSIVDKYGADAQNYTVEKLREKNKRLRAALRECIELADDLYGYAIQLRDWKYGEYWREELAKARKALEATDD